MAVQRSVFRLIAEVVELEPGVFQIEPSAPRMVPKGVSVLGAQFSLLPLDAPMLPLAPGSFQAQLQGRNGPSDDDWVDVLGGDSPVIDDTGPTSVMFDGPDQLVRVSQFAELRLTASIVSGALSDLEGVVFGAFFKTDYPTG